MLGAIEPIAVELTNPEGLSMYVGLAVILYAIRETHVVSNRFIPLIALVLGLLFAWLQFGFFNSETLLAGLRFGILGVGSVATIKYLIENFNKDDEPKNPIYDENEKY